MTHDHPEAREYAQLQQSMGITDDKAHVSPSVSSEKAAPTAEGVTALGVSYLPTLKRCPFCGGEAVFEEIQARAANGVVWSVGCVTPDEWRPGDATCFGHQAVGARFNTKREAAAHWNKRANEVQS